MIVSLHINNKNFEIDTENPLDISIPLKFNGEQPNAYGADFAASKPCKSGELIGDTRQGGSVNFEQYTLIPHSGGTHTECVGHITHERISVRDCLQDAFIPASLISVKAKKAFETEDTYSVALKENDTIISKNSISNRKSQIANSEALIVRTIPNDAIKLKQTYGKYIPPFFSNEAMDFIVKLGVKHLLVDLPSIDRMFDEGKLSNHRKFWNVEEGKFEINENTRMNSTITELIYVRDEIKDGVYLLNLQIAPFEADAAPSRPILFKSSVS